MNKNFLLGLGVSALVALGLTGCSNKTCSVKDSIAPTESKIKPGSPEDFAQNVPTKVYFRFNDATVTGAGHNRVAAQAAWMKTYNNTASVVEGHCDERGTAEYNMALGARRAESVKSALVKNGVDSSRITTISYGKDRPEAVVDPANPANAEAAHAMNRRAETKINR